MLKGLIILLAAGLTGCASTPKSERLVLVGSDWSGTLSREALTVASAGRPSTVVRNTKARRCGEDVCFFGTYRPGHSKYVNARLTDDLRLGSLFDTAPCRLTPKGRIYPYKAAVTFFRPGRMQELVARLEGCAGPPRQFGLRGR